MPKLQYKFIKSDVFSRKCAFMLSGISDGEGDVLISLGSEYGGSLIIDGISYPLKGGIARIPKERLADGTVYPAVICGTKRFELSPFEIKGESVKKASPSEHELEALFSAVIKFEGELIKLENKINALEEKTKGTNLFNFS